MRGVLNRELHRIFTEFSDVIKEEGISQIVGAGPSALPFSRALARAYRRRYGQKLVLVNLGEVGETIARTELKDGPVRVRKLLLDRRPKFDLESKALLLDDVVLRGASLRSLSSALSQAGLDHKSACIVDYHSTSTLPDYVGLSYNSNSRLANDLFSLAYSKRGNSVAFAQRLVAKGKRPEFILMQNATFRARLMKIADSVEPARIR